MTKRTTIITPPEMDATGAFVAPAERRRRTIKEPTVQEPVVIGARRCVGSTTFGIEPHDAAVSDFPVQPSRKDGLGTMCKPHWTEYTRALRRAQRARAKQDESIGETSTERAKRTRVGGAPKPVDPALVAAEQLIREVDALPGPEHVKRVGEDDVQAAFETIAKANGHGRQAPDPVETPLGETIDSGAEEADAYIDSTDGSPYGM